MTALGEVQGCQISGCRLGPALPATVALEGVGDLELTLCPHHRRPVELIVRDLEAFEAYAIEVRG